MGLYVSDTSSKGSFEPIPQGRQYGVCQSIYDIGTQYNAAYDNYQHRVVLIFEFPEHRIELERDGERKDLPRVLSQVMTLSLHPKSKMRPFLEQWRGANFTPKQLESFDLRNLSCVAAEIHIIHNVVGEKTYANISAILPHPDGPGAIDPENSPVFFSLEDDDKIPTECPQWIADKIVVSREFKRINSKPEALPDEKPMGEDVPF